MDLKIILSNMKNILKKLFEVQKEVKAIEKDSTNPYFNSAYFDINKLVAVLKPLLNKNGLIVTQPIQFSEGKNVLFTIIRDVESGEEQQSCISLPDNLEPQKMGSAITYLRRYSLQSLLFLEALDDDGSSASPTNVNKSDYAPRKIASSNTKVIQNPKNDIPFN